MNRWIVTASTIVLSLLPMAGKAQVMAVLPAPRVEAARPAEVTVWNRDLSSRVRWPIFTPQQKTGGHLAIGDLDGDGTQEIVVGAGAGSLPEVQVLGSDGSRRASFFAYAKDFKGGVRVAVGDLDGDGIGEIVTSPGPGMEPLVRRFRADGSFTKPNGFLAYAGKLRSGIRVAVGDLDGDGKAEIVTAPGFGGGAHVRIWRGDFTPLHGDFFAFDDGTRDGLTITLLKTASGPRLAVSVEGWHDPIVRLFAWRDGLFVYEHEFRAYSPGWKHGVLLAGFDHDGDGNDEIVVTPNGGSAADLRVYNRAGEERARLLVMDPAYRGAVSAASADIDGDGSSELITVPLAPSVVGPLDQEKAIHVSVKEQRLYAYERGRIARTFLVSTGTYKYPTPIMETTVLKKTPVKRYRWVYGIGHPDNYDLPNVKWNLQIKGPYNIHGTYWHNNFGRRMSHGCVNLHNTNAEWIYGWADVGTPVKTYIEQPRLSVPDTQMTSL